MSLPFLVRRILEEAVGENKKEEETEERERRVRGGGIKWKRERLGGKKNRVGGRERSKSSPE